mmetsp:Transcript_13439/g.29188  ORF Transcript_13439/g.29188 Transcript_13439/m.29188 type:complete len:216 (-) Transcript_13439:332-979(-)
MLHKSTLPWIPNTFIRALSVCLPTQLLSILLVCILHQLRSHTLTPKIQVHKIRSQIILIGTLRQSIRHKVLRVGNLGSIQIRRRDKVVHNKKVGRQRILLRSTCDFTTVFVILQIVQRCTLILSFGCIVEKILKSRGTSLIGARSSIEVKDNDALILLHQIAHRRPIVPIRVIVDHIRKAVDIVHFCIQIVPYNGLGLISRGFEEKHHHFRGVIV